MIGSKIKAKLLPGLIRKAKKANARPLVSGSGRIGLIVDAKDLEKKSGLLKIHDLAGYPKKDCKLVICGSRKEIVDVNFPVILDPSEISIGGKFESEDIRNFIATEFDFLICNFSESCLHGMLLAASSKVSVKIGNSPDEFGVFDLEIEAENPDVFQQETLKYIEIFKKNR
ncbi:hypothetical protein MKO06_07485 [Gramella sp. GC03-9]|uniref:Uncharacterized protein n=1 Tax=Christiangramia oceanisediminis TaxID=2920386 RepID=A0A9X2KXG4_9FLAO|nr:hypothetical protein [Gramella oceanisediminis]MCP9199741.1 hypothetical protein [Gramella oceanisediminis]